MFLVYFIDDLWVKSVKSGGNGPIFGVRELTDLEMEDFKLPGP